VRLGAKIGRAFFFSFFLFLKEKRTLQRNGASKVFGTDGLKDNTPTAEEMDGIRCTKRLIIHISETCKGILKPHSKEEAACFRDATIF